MTKRDETVERPKPVQVPEPTRGPGVCYQPKHAPDNPAPPVGAGSSAVRPLLIHPDVVERCLNYWLCTHSPIIRIMQNEKAEIGCACGWRPQVEGQTYRQHISHELAIHVAQSLNHELRR